MAVKPSRAMRPVAPSLALKGYSLALDTMKDRYGEAILLDGFSYMCGDVDFCQAENLGYWRPQILSWHIYCSI
jgi:hypothetical protein